MPSAAADDEIVLHASQACKEFCQTLRRDRYPCIRYNLDLTRPADSKLIEKTLEECDHIESVAVVGPSGLAAFVETVHWECLEHFLQHASLDQVILCGALHDSLYLAVARNHRVRRICLKGFFRLSAPALSKFLGRLRSSELELHQTFGDARGLQLMGFPSLKHNVFLRKLVVVANSWEGAKPLAQVLLKNLPHFLESLCLSTIYLGISGPLFEPSYIDSISELSNLKTLELCLQTTGEDGLLRYLRTTTVLECLKLHVSYKVQLSSICDAVTANPSIKSLDFDVTCDNDAVFGVLNTFLKQSVYLKSLKLSGVPVPGSVLFGLLSSLEMNNTLDELETWVRPRLDLRLLSAALQRLKGLRVLTITPDTWSLNREGVAEDVDSSLELNLSLFEVRGGVFEAGRQQHRGRLEHILCRNRHLANAQEGDRLPTDLWPRFLESSLRNSEVGASFVYEYLRKDLTWAHK